MHDWVVEHEYAPTRHDYDFPEQYTVDFKGISKRVFNNQGLKEDKISLTPVVISGRTIEVDTGVEELKLKRTKKGDKMAALRVEDLTGSTEVIIFPDLFSKTSPLLKGDEPLLISLDFRCPITAVYEERELG